MITRNFNTKSVINVLDSSKKEKQFNILCLNHAFQIHYDKPTTMHSGFLTNRRLHFIRNSKKLQI